MKASRLRFGEIVIILFCVWHMAAIGIYNLRDPKSGPFIGLTAEAKAIISPYVLNMSQWQQWEIFAPEPLQRMALYRIEANRKGEWKAVKYLDPEHLSWRNRVKELKILERLEEKGWPVLVPSYLLSWCGDLPDAKGTLIRLVADATTLPVNLPELKKMSTTILPKTETVLGSTVCP